MKVKDITLQVNGREMTFSEEELTAILEKHFGETTAETAKAEKKTKARAKAEPIKTEAKPTAFAIAPKPIEGMCFEVNPMEIDRSLFQEKRRDTPQETTRRYILEAFDKVDKHPEEYAKPFKTLIPIKIWDGSKTVKELKQYAKVLGDHLGNGTEQALEWAQRLSNGETWEAICNEADTVKWYRLVAWGDGHLRLVGGSRFDTCYPPTLDVYFSNDKVYTLSKLVYTVPFVVLY